MKGKTKAIITVFVVILAGIYYYAAIPANQHSFIGDMVFYHDLSGDPGCSVSGKKEIEQI